jgi:hypothetical protein
MVISFTRLLAGMACTSLAVLPSFVTFLDHGIPTVMPEAISSILKCATTFVALTSGEPLVSSTLRGSTLSRTCPSRDNPQKEATE